LKKIHRIHSTDKQLTTMNYVSRRDERYIYIYKFWPCVFSFDFTKSVYTCR